MQSGKPSSIVRNSRLLLTTEITETLQVPYIIPTRRNDPKRKPYAENSLAKTNASSVEKPLSRNTQASELSTPGTQLPLKPALSIEQNKDLRRVQVLLSSSLEQTLSSDLSRSGRSALLLRSDFN